MMPCACSMSSLHVHGARPCCLLSQLWPGRRILWPERSISSPERSLPGPDSTGMALRSATRYRNIGRRSTLIHSFSLGGLDSLSVLRKTPSKSNGMSMGFEGSSKILPRRKFALEVNYRVQDTVDSGAITEDEAEYTGLRNRDRSRKQRYGERRRKVQILSNNGLVDLEEHLGMIKDDERTVKDRYRTKSISGDEAQRISTVWDNEGRTSLKMSISNNGIEEMQETNESIPSDNFASQQTRSLEGNLYSSSSSDAGTSSGFADDVLKLELAKDVPSISFCSNSDGQDVWDRNGIRWPTSLAELPGGRRVVELVAAWDGLAGRLPPEFLRTTGSDLLLRALKLTVMALHHASADDEGRIPLCRALAVAHTLADLGMDAEVISAGLLREVVDSGLVAYATIEQSLGANVARLLRDSSRVRRIPSRVETLDDDSAKALRQFCLAFHDVCAIVVELASQLDTMKHIHSIPRYRQQILALETMQIYAPLAHAIGTSSMALELEDLGFRVLFPDSYFYIENWLRSHWVDGGVVVDKFKEELLARLGQDAELQSLVTTVNVLGRYKSRFSTMRKLLRDGRKPEEVYDVLGLRVILESIPDEDGIKHRTQGVRACYRAYEIATSIWKEVPGRLKDYIAHRKENGYESLHFAVRVSNDHDNRQPPMEIQIRTAEMDAAAVSGEASHALYKGGMTNPEQIRNLKLLMVAAANAAASRFGEIAGSAVGLEGGDHTYDDDKDKIFKMFDKNQDGVISIEEFREVISELGADEGDAMELMQIVDSNMDGFLSFEEFSKFRHQIKISQNLAGVDREFSSQLGSKLQASSENEVSQQLLSSGKLSNNVVRFVPLKLEDNVESTANTKLPSQQYSDLSPVDAIPAELFDEGMGSSTTDSSTVSNADDIDNKTRPQMQKLEPKLVKPLPPSGNLPSPAFHEASAPLPVMGEKVSKLQSGLKISKVGDLKAVGDKDEVFKSSIDQELAIIRQLTASGDVQAALVLASQLTEKYPASTKALLHQASLERKSGWLEAASYLYRKAVNIFKLKEDLGIDYVRALHAWASLEREAGNGMRAKRLFAESIDASLKGDAESNLRNAGVYGLHGWARLEEKSGNWSRARDLLERAANLQPGNAVIHQSRASLEARVHNFSAARMHFKRAVEAAPEDVVCWHAWANFEGTRGNWRKMRQLFRRALEIDPKNVHSLQAWARHEGLTGTEESRTQARKLYQKLVEINPYSTYCWQSWGVLEQEAGNFEGARALFELGLKVNKESVPCLQAYAHMERKCGNLTEAVILLQRALAVEPSNAAVLMELALIKEMSGDADSALNLYKRAAKMDRQKSLVKRRMFESRKRDVYGPVTKSKGVGRLRRRRAALKSFVAREAFSGPGSSTDEFEKRYERIHPVPTSGHNVK